MWQRFFDCDIYEKSSSCNRLSIPNQQGVLIDLGSRNILIGFNKRLGVWRYEKSNEH